jgi:hypothetical protein
MTCGPGEAQSSAEPVGGEGEDERDGGVGTSEEVRYLDLLRRTQSVQLPPPMAQEDLRVQSVPGDTHFQVRLPLTAPEPAAIGF